MIRFWNSKIIAWITILAIAICGSRLTHVSSYAAERTVTVYVNDYVMVNGVKTKLGETHAFCFNNSPRDRAALVNVVPNNYYNAILDVWGDTPIVKDPVTGPVVVEEPADEPTETEA